MAKVLIRNPYFEKEYMVSESAYIIEHQIRNVALGNEPFLHLHSEEGPIIITPQNCATVEVSI